MTKILWMSRHCPSESQKEGLRQMFGEDIRIDLEPRPFDDARQIAERYKNGGYDDMVVVAPLSVIAVLCTAGVKMLWSEAAEENDPKKIEFRGARGQGYRFVRYRRLRRIVMEFED